MMTVIPPMNTKIQQLRLSVWTIFTHDPTGLDIICLTAGDTLQMQNDDAGLRLFPMQLPV